MRREITYVACDGKRLDDETVCLEYEASLRNDRIDGKIYFWSLSREPLPLTTRTAEHAYFIYVKDKSAVPCACELFEESGSSHPWHDFPPEDNALYYYDTAIDEWRLYSSDHDFYAKMWKMVNDTVGYPVFAEPRIRDLLDRCMSCINDLVSTEGPDETLYLFEAKIGMWRSEIRDLGWGELLGEDA